MRASPNQCWLHSRMADSWVWGEAAELAVEQAPGGTHTAGRGPHLRQSDVFLKIFSKYTYPFLRKKSLASREMQLFCVNSQLPSTHLKCC